MVRFSYFLFIAIVLISAASTDLAAQTTNRGTAPAPVGGGSSSQNTVNLPHPYAGSKLDHKVIPAPGNTWGYEISVNGKPYIRQTTVPGAAGVKGFPTRKEADDAALEEIKRIRGAEAETQAVSYPNQRW